MQLNLGASPRFLLLAASFGALVFSACSTKVSGEGTGVDSESGGSTGTGEGGDKGGDGDGDGDDVTPGGGTPATLCEEDADCSDGKSCNGAEACLNGYCVVPSSCEDDCAINHGGCSKAASCTDSEDGPVCECLSGFTGDGVDCVSIWSEVHVISELDDLRYAGVGNGKIYLANKTNHADQVANPGIFLSWAPGDESASLLSITGAPFCWCGYTGTAVGVNDDVYYLAGDGYHYDTNADTWGPTAWDDAENPRGEAGVAVLGDLIYQIGGRNYLAAVQAYDTLADSWSAPGSIADYPWAVADVKATGYDGKIWVFGGQTSMGQEGIAAVYDPAENDWSTLESTPAGLSYPHDVSTVGDQIYVLTGEVHVFDPATETWVGTIPIPAGVSHAASIDGQYYLLKQSDDGIIVMELAR